MSNTTDTNSNSREHVEQATGTLPDAVPAPNHLVSTPTDGLYAAGVWLQNAKTAIQSIPNWQDIPTVPAIVSQLTLLAFTCFEEGLKFELATEGEVAAAAEALAEEEQQNECEWKQKEGQE